jgi:hypothetical protein
MVSEAIAETGPVRTKSTKIATRRNNLPGSEAPPSINLALSILGVRKDLRMNEESTLSGWWVFAGVLLLVAGVLNIIYGIAAIGDSKFFTENATYIISGLHTWGWIILILGVLELVAAFSLFSGGEFGRWFGIFIASLNAIGALLSIPAYPFWSLAIFALAIIIIYKLSEGPEGTVS